jgi:outer membrane protein
MRKTKQKHIYQLFFTLGVIGLQGFTGAFGQEGWTLEKCIQYGLENNISIKQSELDAQISEGDVKQAKGSFLPTVSGNIYGSFTSGQYYNSVTYDPVNGQQTSANFSIDGNLPLYTGNQRTNILEYYKLNLQSRLKEIEKAKNDIALNIASAYLQVLYYKEMLATAENQLSLTQIQVERIQKLVEAGSVPEGNLSEIKAQYASDKMQVVDAQNNLNISTLNLTQLLEIKESGNFTVVAPEMLVPADSGSLGSVAEIYNQAIGFLPEIQSAQITADGTKYLLNYQKGAYYPSLVLGSRIYTQYSKLSNTNAVNTSFNTQFKDNAYRSIYLSLNIPIFNNFKTSNAVNTARINSIKAENQLEIVRKNVYKEIQQAYNNAISAWNKLQSSLEAQKAYAVAFRYASQKFEAGASNIVEYNTAKTNLTKVESELLQAKYEYVFRTKILDFYRGKQITLN